MRTIVSEWLPRYADRAAPFMLAARTGVIAGMWEGLGKTAALWRKSGGATLDNQATEDAKVVPHLGGKPAVFGGLREAHSGNNKTISY
jgi:hypothetical protein